MALREYYLGTVGPFYYDDTDTYDDDPLINHCALRTPQQLYIGTAPVGDKQVVRLEDLNTELGNYIAADGSIDLTGNLNVDPGITIDGVDISVHAANPWAHHSVGDVLSTILCNNNEVVCNNNEVVWL